MRVLLTGHQGYLGTVMAPILTAAGHDVTGLDSGLFADVHPRRPRHPGRAGPRRRPARRHRRPARRLRRRRAHGGAVQRPAGRARPRDHLRRQPPRVHPARPAGQGRGRRPLRLRLHVLGVRRAVRRRARRRGRAAASRSRRTRVEGPRRGRPASRWPTTTSCRSRCATPPRSGSRPRLRADIVLNNLVGHAVLTDVVKVLSDGTPWRPLVHAEDIAGGVLAALAAPPTWCAAGPTTSAPSANNRTVAEIAQAVVEAVPTAKLAITGETGNDPRSYRVDFARARKELGFEAAWTIPDGANQLAREYRERDLTREQFDQRFTRLAVLAARQKAGELDDTMRVRGRARPRPTAESGWWPSRRARGRAGTAARSRARPPRAGSCTGRCSRRCARTSPPPAAAPPR